MADEKKIPREEITLRPARAEDTAQVMELDRTIWDGDDYIPQVWEEWLKDPKGQLVAAEYQGKIVGFGRLVEVTPMDWYLQGLRIDPEFQGRGIASILHEEILRLWEQVGQGTLRLMTHAKRYPVHHLCDRTGFTRLGEYYFFRAPALPGPPEGLQPIALEEVDEAVAFTADNPIRELTGGVMDLPWVQSGPARETFEPAIRLGQAFWWKGRGGLLFIGIDTDEKEEPLAYIQYLVCRREELVDFLMDARRAADSLGHKSVGWLTLVHPEMMPIIKEAGFERGWDDSTFIYEKREGGADNGF